MKPALSVIFFTVMSGSGYGLLFLCGLEAALDPTRTPHRAGIALLGVGLVLVAAGLFASTMHLGKPQRAWRALTQWRSSWLSREGVAAILSFVPALTLLACLARDATAPARIAGLVLALLSLTTVICTAKIYTSLKTIPAWHNAWVLPGYVLFAALGGITARLALGALFGIDAPAGLWPSCAILGVAATIWKHRYWRWLDRGTQPLPTPAHATGLARFGEVRGGEAPHSEANYLTREMGFVLARKHAAALRRICLWLIGPLFAGAILTAWFASSRGITVAAIPALAAWLFTMTGLFVERWLFFAEARHVVMSYYTNPYPVHNRP